MKTKKIWIWAIILGLIATVTLYFALFYHQDGQTTNKQTNATSTEQKPELKGDTSNSDDNNDTSPKSDKGEENNKDESEKVEEEEKNEFIMQDLLPIDDGKRAISINVTSNTEGVEGYLKPGYFVDVIALTPSKEEWNHDDESQLLLQNVKVLAVGKATDDQEKAANYQSVTLEVSPEDGLRLTLAQYDGQLYLMLRNEGDESKIIEHIHFHADQLHWGGHLTQ